MDRHDIYILHDNVSNSTQYTPPTDITNENINDYLYYQVYVKNKKTKKINMKKHIDFFKNNTSINNKPVHSKEYIKNINKHNHN